MGNEKIKSNGKRLLIIFCLIQLLLDAFFIYYLFGQTNRIGIQQEILEDFIDQGSMLGEKFYILSVYHNRLVESFFVGNKKLETTTKDFIFSMTEAAVNNETVEFDRCIAQYENPIIIEEPLLLFGSTEVTGYIMHLYNPVSLEEIGYTVFEEEFVDHNIFKCGHVFYNATSEELDIITFSMGSLVV